MKNRDVTIIEKGHSSVISNFGSQGHRKGKIQKSRKTQLGYCDKYASLLEFYNISN